MFKSAIIKFSLSPRKLFLIDGIGALISATFWVIILVRFETFFGIPRAALYLLASFPCFFAVYDFYCYSRIKNNIRIFLKIIAYSNFIYCCISIIVAIYHYQIISVWAWMYISLEIVIVLSLIIVELGTVKKLTVIK